MKSGSYHYHILIQDAKRLGPFDRRTVIGMRIKKLITSETEVVRDDGHRMSVAQLLADRFEMADAESLHRQAVSPPASGIWPTFLTDFGGSAIKHGALGFVGKGEIRFQGDLLRWSGRRRAGLIGTQEARIKIPLAAIASARRSSDGQSIGFMLKPGSVPEIKLGAGVVRFDSSECVGELLEMMNLP